VLIGVNKEIEEQEAGIFVDSPLQTYDDLEGAIFQLKDLQDRKALFDAVDEFNSKIKDFHGVYWDIFLDFLLSEEDKTLYDLSVKLSRVIPGQYRRLNPLHRHWQHRFEYAIHHSTLLRLSRPARTRP